MARPALVPCKDCKRPMQAANPKRICSRCVRELDLRSLVQSRGRTGTNVGIASQERILELAALAAAGLPLFTTKRRDH